MKYHIQEGMVNLPEDGEDETINIIKFSTLQSVLVITRARLAEGESLDGYYDQQMAQLKRTMKNFIVDEKRAVTVSSPEEQRCAYQTRCEFDQQGQKMHQCLLFTVSRGHLLVLAYSKPGGFSATDLTHWQGITASLVLH